MIRLSSELQRIETDLAQEVLELDLLTDVLRRERQALAGGPGEAIAELAAEKEEHTACLARMGAARDEALRARGILHGMPELLEGMQAGSALHAAWRRLMDRARVAALHNSEIGILIQAQSRHIGARLAALASTNPASTYGADGASRPGSPGRTLGAA